MQPEFDFDNLLITVSHSFRDCHEKDRSFECGFPYIRELGISFALKSENGLQQVLHCDESVSVCSVGALSGTLILGSQAFCDGEDFAALCDDYSADLCVVATELENAGLVDDSLEACCDVFVVRSLELSKELVDAANLQELFDGIPHIVFHHTGVMPQICCNLVAGIEGYYEMQEEQTKYDPRSAGGYSIQIFIDNGYWLTESGDLLVRVYGDEAAVTECYGFGYDEEDADFKEELADRQSLSANPDTINEVWAYADRHTLEDHIAIVANATAIHLPRDAPSRLMDYVRAALVAYNLGTTFDYAYKYLLPKEEPAVSAIHLAFQEMYYAGMHHMEATQKRMDPRRKPSAGEVFADSALSRAMNTYYVAALLYREGHMIEAHAMSRLMLEQIAWSFSVFEKQDRGEAEKVAPTKAIGKLKKKIELVGRLYGTLSQNVHLPLKGHDEFIDVSGEESSAYVQFGVYSYYHGIILARLADYWASVYEYTQAVHFERLENWIEESSGLVLNPERPFLKEIEPILGRLVAIYDEQFPAYEDFIDSNWTLKDDAERHA